MTRLNDDNLKKVERALTEAHRSRQEPSFGPDWAHPSHAGHPPRWQPGTDNR